MRQRDRTGAVSRESTPSVTAETSRGRDGGVWTVATESMARGTLRGEVRLGGRAATVAEVLASWRDEEELRATWNDALASVPFEAFRWETPATTVGTITRAFEFVVLDAPSLVVTPEPEVFAEHFTGAEVVTFANLGGDAVLVVPAPLESAPAYPHLGAFVRGAPPTQRDALWRSVATAMHGRIGAKPVWLSTAGGGVAWLHVRLDDRPKYYAHAPYRLGPQP